VRVRRIWVRRILIVLAALLALLIICCLFCKLPRGEPEVPAVVSLKEAEYIVPQGSWYIFGPLSGSRIRITANVSMDVMVGVASAVFMATEFPNGSVTWREVWGNIALVRDGEYYAVVLNDICYAGRPFHFAGWVLVVPEAVGTVGLYENLCKKVVRHPALWRGDIRVDYTTFGNKAILTMLFGLHGGGSARGVPSNPARTEFIRYYYQNTRSVDLYFDVYEKRVDVYNTTYVIYMRPAVWIAVKPSADALVTIKVSAVDDYVHKD
jgi:hypothetical protein